MGNDHMDEKPFDLPEGVGDIFLSKKSITDVKTGQQSDNSDGSDPRIKVFIPSREGKIRYFI
jgi:hypothetical protein